MKHKRNMQKCKDENAGFDGDNYTGLLLVI